MDLASFEARALEMWEEIPPAFREGVDGVVVHEEAEAHPEHPDYFTLGMCLTEPYPSGYTGPETTRSVVALYWGSFVEVAALDPDFAWEEELWETLTHELRHHLEFLADDEALLGLDHAMDEGYKRSIGEPFDPWYWQHGLPLAPGVFRVEFDVYLEQRWRAEAFAAARCLTFDWDGQRWEIDRPDQLGDIHWIWIDGVEVGEGSLQLVLVRERSVLTRLGDWVRWGRAGDGLDLLESEAEARAIGVAQGSPGPQDGRPGRGAGGPPQPPRHDRREDG